MNIGAFMMVAHLAGPGERRTLIEDISGLAYERPGIAACLTVLLLSLAGIPTTAGFLAKFYIFRAAVHSHLIGLTILAVLNSVVSVYYYLRPVVAMYMREGRPVVAACLPWTLRAVLALSLTGIFYLGLYPNDVLALASLAASPLP
jgi:NADH-quinone oxidoreductase subunit N